jgi:hypothetical protein
VIVRIATEGQYEVPEDKVDELNRLDNAAVEAVDAGDEARFHETFDAMIALVREVGSAVADDDLSESALILPPSDLTFEEAGEQFTGDGLIPD